MKLSSKEMLLCAVLAEWHGKDIPSVYDMTHNLLEHLQIFLRATEDSREVGLNITKFKGHVTRGNFSCNLQRNDDE